MNAAPKSAPVSIRSEKLPTTVNARRRPPPDEPFYFVVSDQIQLHLTPPARNPPLFPTLPDDMAELYRARMIGTAIFFYLSFLIVADSPSACRAYKSRRLL